MPNKIIHKKTGTTGLAPAPGELDHAELAVNYADGDLYLKNLAGDAVVKVTAASNIKNTPAGNIAATTVQAALNELDTEKQPTTNSLAEINADLADGDHVPVYDASAAAARKSLISRIWTYIKAKIAGEAVVFSAGSASAPAITTTSDPNTGIYFPEADTVAIATGGVEALRVQSNHSVYVTNGEIIIVDQNEFFRSASGNYGVIFRQDSTNFYLMLTNSGDKYGSFNSLRPISINLADGNVGINNDALAVMDGKVLIGTIIDNATGAKLQVNGAVTFIPGSSRTPSVNGQVTFELTNNTTLKIKAKGSDGTVRSVSLTLA